MRGRGENRRKVMEYIKACAPRGVSSGDIARRTGVSQASAYQIAQALMKEGFVRAARDGRTWRFSWNTEGRPPAGSATASSVPPREEAGRTFPAKARRAMEAHYGCPFELLNPDELAPAWRLVAEDGEKLGYALHLAPLPQGRMAAGRLCLVSGLVWLLEKSEAGTPFVVLGGDETTARSWQRLHASCSDEVDVFFLHEDGRLSCLT